MLMDHTFRGWPGKGWLSGQHLVQQTPECILIAASIKIRFGRRLLGTHVADRTDGQSRFGQRKATHRLDRLRNTEGRDHGMTTLKQDVLRLDIAMHHATTVRVLQRICDLARDLQGVVDGQLLVAIESVAQRLALDVWHDVEQGTGRLARVIERQNVRVPQICCRLDLAPKPFRPQRHGHVRPQHLHRHAPMVLQILGQIHRGHAADAEHPLQSVAVSECGLQGG